MIQKFYLQNIICHFGVPKSFTAKNGTQFDSEAFKSFCSHVGPNIHFASVRHLESNELVEKANGIILLGITRALFGLLKGNGRKS
jgi:transposase InsO family protein